MPVPVSIAVCVLLAALSVKVSASLFAPVDAGLKTTETVHEAPPASCDGEVGQLFADNTKSVPVEIALIVRAELWLSVKVRVFVPEVPPTATFPQPSVVGDIVTSDVVPPVDSIAVPLR